MKIRIVNLSILHIFIIFSCLFCSISNAQKVSSSQTKDYTILDKAQGLEVYDIDAMIFDNQNWLWIAGNSLDLINDADIRRVPIIQRFNGESFITIDLPDFGDNIVSELILKKGANNNLFAIFSGSKRVVLYSVNTETLEFQEIKFPSSITNKYFSIFPFNDQFRIFLSDGVDTHLYDLDANLKPKRLPHNPVTRGVITHAPYFKSFVDLGYHYLVNEARSGVYLYNEDGSLLKNVTYETLGFTKGTFDFHLNIRATLKRNDTQYVAFEKIDSLYVYDAKKHTFKETSLSNKITSISGTPELYVSDTFNNTIQVKVNMDETVINHYLENQAFRAPIVLEQSKIPKGASRNLEKELFIAQAGRILYFNYETSKVKTFLNDKSIRAIHEISKEEFLVATEESGWYTVNTNTLESEKFSITLQGKNYIPFGSKFIFEDTTHYWSSDSRGVLKVNKKTGAAISYIFYPISGAKEVGNKIYYGTKLNSLFEFDKLTGISKELQQMRDRNSQNLLKIGDTIYIACLEGLEVYKDGKTRLHTPGLTSEDNAFFCIENTESYGILLGSKSGKVYQFDPIQETFNVLYEDEIKASIATILHYDTDKLWLNTFNGYVSFNPKDATTKRYGSSDGYSFNEANRYSALKTTTGHLMVGTLNGLNYFHPDQMEKMSVEGQLYFSKISYYESSTNKNITITAPQKLNALKQISLDPEDRNLIVQYGLNGNFSASDITYRYKLNDQPWANTDSELRLFNLAPGGYTLQIEALNSSETNIGAPLFLEIYANDFFYNRTWFLLVVLGLLIGISYWIYRQQRGRFLLKEKFSLQIIQTQERERVRIAKNLHDNVGQRLLILKNSILLNTDNDAEKTTMITEAIKEVREMSHNLHPFQFEKLGLETSLKDMVETFQKNSTIFYSEAIENVANQIPKEKEIVVFRMLQECMTNVEKHAEATACNLSSETTPKYLKFVLKDNGKGFDTNDSNTQNGLGMRTLKERARFLESNFQISSALGKGTTITITLAKK